MTAPRFVAWPITERSGKRYTQPSPTEAVPLTVCIAALCHIPGGQKWSVVAASDRMFTAGDTQFEPNQRKQFQFNKRVVALVADDIAVQVSICAATLAAFGDPETAGVAEIAEVYSEQYRLFRRRMNEENILSPLGLTFDTFISRQGELAPQLLQQLTTELKWSAVPATTIIAGVDTTGAHIFVVSDPGVYRCCDGVGFAAIGSGGSHASSQFMGAHYTSGTTLSKALFMTFAAKKRAEVASGVGRFTDLLVISHPDGQILIEDPVKIELQTMYDKIRANETAALQSACEDTQTLLDRLTAEAQQLAGRDGTGVK